VPVQDKPMNEESLTIQLDLTIPVLPEQITEESVEQEPKDISLELDLSSQDSILMKDKSDNLYNNIINRYSVSSIFNLLYMVLKKKCLMVC
jgi:hypothetical protein